MQEKGQKIAQIKTRILQYIEKKGIKKVDFLELSNISASNFKSTGMYSEIGGDKIAQILSIFPDMNPTWLVTGNGQMLLESNNKTEIMTPVSETSIENNIVSGSIPSLSSNKGVPYFDVDFIGGFDLVTNDNSVQPSYLIDFPPFNDADYWVNITGKSMSPFISHGDMVALKRFDSWKDFILFGEIYAIVTDDFRTIKIVGQGKDEDHLGLIPYSKSREFSEQDIPKRLIRHMFKVKGSIKKFF